MQVKLVPIGNSKGIRLSKQLLGKFNIKDKVELTVEDDKIILQSVNNPPRTGWSDAARKMHETKDDEQLFPDLLKDDLPEW